MKDSAFWQASRMATTVAILLAASSCSALGLGSPDPDTSHANGSGSGYAAYEAAAEQHAYLSEATEELTRRCVAAAGFSYWPTPQLPAKYRSPAQPLSVEEAQTAGYAAFLPPPAPGESEQDAYLESLSTAERAAYDTVLSGADGGKVVTVQTAAGEVKVGLGGCRGQAQEQVFPDADDLTQFLRLDFQVSNFTGMPAFAPDADPALAEATRSWSQCMESRGRPYANPGLAVEAAGELSPDPTAPSSEAIAIAVDDATCRASTGYDTANAAAVKNALAVVADSLEGDLLTYQELTAAGSARARELLG